MDILSDRCQLLAFHRAGCGDSDPNPYGPSVFHAVRDLRGLLHARGVQEPVILVGHSYGGLCVQRFACEYPDNVAGVVLVDSTSTDMARLDAFLQASDDEWLLQCKQFASMSPQEILLANDSLLSPYQLTLPQAVIKRIVQFYTNPRLYQTMMEEAQVWHMCAEKTQESGPFPDIPLKVIARDPLPSKNLLVEEGVSSLEAELFEQTWHELIQAQSRLSAKGELITAVGASHCIYENRADLIIDVIRDVVTLCYGS